MDKEPVVNTMELWQRYRQHLCVCEEIGLRLDISRMFFDDHFFERMTEPMARAYEAMAALEAGAIANPDENRRVGHYWLRDPQRAPSAEIAETITSTQQTIRQFAAQVHDGRLAPPQADRFTDLLVIGIGGSALGPQFLADALGDERTDRLQPHFFDNTDPDGMARVLGRIGQRLRSTLVVVISKSGTTPETRNGMVTAQQAFAEAGLEFARQAVAVTAVGSKLDELAQAQDWLLRLGMWDWVGGRTSVSGPVGLLPGALQGIDIDAMLVGARDCDARTRRRETADNPAALMALMWYAATNGRGEKDMVVLPYKDRLLLFSRYLQQLIMESLGKAVDLDGKPVEQGITVYGNKGSTDQHAYVQQLREGVNNFFVTFIEVLTDGGEPIEVQPGFTAGDYLRGLYRGTREALYENGRASMTLTIERVDARTVGVLIALFERAVGFYATLVNINAYHQPGVEAGKRAAAEVLALQKSIVGQLASADQPQTAEQIAQAIGAAEQVETVFGLLEGLAINGRVTRHAGEGRWDSRYGSV